MSYIPLSSIEHKLHGYQAEKPFVFAAKVDFLPLSLEEITKVNGLFPMCFKKTELGFEFGIPTHFISQANALIHPGNGKFLLPYVPAVLRRYPFNVAKVKAEQYALLVLEEEQGFAENYGEAIIDADGRLTEKGQGLQLFLSKLNASFELLKKQMALLSEMEILQPIKFQLPEGAKVEARQDLYKIDEQALNQLSAEKLKELMEAGVMPIIYAHLLNISLMDRLSKAVELFAKLNQEASQEIDLEKMFDDDDSDVLKF